MSSRDLDVLGREKKSVPPRRRVSRTTSDHKNHRRLNKYLLTGVGIVLVVGGAGGVWIAQKGLQLRSELLEAGSLVPALKTHIFEKDFVSADETLNKIQKHVSVAKSAATDPLWKVASALPWIGPNLSAGTEIALSADDVVTGAAVPLLAAADSLDWESLTPSKGKIDVAPLAEAAPEIASAAHTVQLTHARLSNIDHYSLHSEVADPLLQATNILGELGEGLDDAANAASLLPSMLGTKEPRQYLILMQNNAEVRATGGLPGALAVIRVNDGELELTSQVSGAALGRFDPPIEVAPDQVRIYSSRLGAYISDVNLTPDFPTAAQSAKTMWENRYGTVLDGVVAIDPVVLANVLAASGPVTVPQEFVDPANRGLPSTLTADNVVQTLLSDVYLLLDKNEQQDAYFASVAREVFNGVSSGSASSEQLVNALVQSTAEDRLHLWSVRESEQKLLQDTVLGGAITGPSSRGTSFGVYFNDGTGAKMDYYVRRQVQLIEACAAGEYSEFAVRVTLTNTAPSDAATSLPESVTGGGKFGTPPGSIQTNLVVYGPSQSLLDTASQDEAKISFGSYKHHDRPVGMTTTLLAPGQTTVVELNFVKVVQETTPKVVVTPTIQSVHDVSLTTKTTECTTK